MSLPPVVRRSFRRVQHGAGSIAITFLILFLITAALATTFSLSGAVSRDSSLAEQQVEALFLAESGMARALNRFGNSVACTSLTTDDSVSHSLGQGTFQVISTATTDFSGTNLASNQCRVRVSGTVSGVTRTIETIMQKSTNGFPPSANSDFNLPSGSCNPPSCTPTNWTFAVSNATNTKAWDDTGGSSLSTPLNSRAAYLSKTTGTGAGISAGGYTFSPPITRTGGSVLTLSFDYKNRVQGSAKKMQVQFRLYEQATPAKSARFWTSSTFQGGDTTPSGQPSQAWETSGVTIASPYYASPSSPTITLNNSTAGEKIYINAIDIDFQLQPGNINESWLDNIKIDGADTGITTEEKVVVLQWREIVQ